MEKSMISSYSKNLMCMPERTQNLKRIQAISVLQQSILIRCCQKSEAKITRSRKKKEEITASFPGKESMPSMPSDL
jgi:hypothetical protein